MMFNLVFENFQEFFTPDFLYDSPQTLLTIFLIVQ